MSLNFVHQRSRYRTAFSTHPCVVCTHCVSPTAIVMPEVHQEEEDNEERICWVCQNLGMTRIKDVRIYTSLQGFRGKDCRFCDLVVRGVQAVFPELTTAQIAVHGHLRTNLHLSITLDTEEKSAGLGPCSELLHMSMYFSQSKFSSQKVDRS